MDPRGLIEDLVQKLAPNATVVAIREEPERYRVTVARPSGVVADCELPRQVVEAAAMHRSTARARLAVALKRCADDVDARIPDGRG
jgi:hypothetical protein